MKAKMTARKATTPLAQTYDPVLLSMGTVHQPSMIGAALEFARNLVAVEDLDHLKAVIFQARSVYPMWKGLMLSAWAEGKDPSVALAERLTAQAKKAERRIK